MTAPQQAFDIAIIGSGIAGSALGTILSRHGLKVIIFEAKSHPKFAIGESMILETSETMRAVAELFDVPELAYFSSENYLSHIGTSHGVKRHFSFLHHLVGQPHQPNRTLQAVIPKEPHGHELHLYRQDSDYFLMATAIAYGATVLQNTAVGEIEVEGDGVTISTQNSQVFQAKYVVDAGGFRSLLADKFALRDFDLQTHSRAIFTHMVDVPDFHKVAGSKKLYDLPYSIVEGTIHHVFEGGWLWVIPFNNHPQSTNALCSVGLMLDPRLYPKQDDLSPEAEFFSFIERFPDIHAHLKQGKPVRNWVRTGRIQYSSKRIVGDRYSLLGHAAGFIDPLFSKGLYVSWMSLAMLAHLLLKAQTSGDYSAAAFQPLETMTLNYLRANDRLAANAYRSFGNHQLWSVYSVLWLLGAYTELVKLTSMRTQTIDRDDYFNQAQGLRLAGGGFADFERLADQIDTLVERVNLADEAEVAQVVAEIKAHLLGIDWLPRPFAKVLAGKTYLPKNKLRLGLLNQKRGFMGQGAYRRHFFGNNPSTPALLKVFLREKVRYSGASLNLRRRLRVAAQ